MRNLQQLLAEVEQKLDRAQLEWFRSVPDPIQPLIKGWSNTQVWALAVPLLPTLLGEWVRECACQQAPIHHSTIDKLVKVEAKDITPLSAEYETLLLRSGVEPEEFFKRDVILDRLVIDSQDILKRVWE